MRQNTQLKLLINETIDENPGVVQLRDDVEQLKVDVAELKVDVAELKVDVRQLKVDVRQLKVDVAELKTELSEVKRDLKEFKNEVNRRLDKLEHDFHVLGLKFESMQNDIRLILDAIIPDRSKALKVDRIEVIVEDHEHRIVAVEHTVTGHIKDHENTTRDQS